MTNTKAHIMFPLIAIAVLGLMFAPQQAYAGFEEPVDHGQVIEVHCEIHYEWEMFLIFGERFGYGECVYIYEDEFEQEEEVEIGGEFEVPFFEEGIPITGGFHIEDDVGNTLWLSEEGNIELDCGDTEPEESEIPYCLETEVTVDEGEGIFEGLTGSGTREAFGYITEFDFPNFEGEAYTTLWITFDFEGEEVIEEEKNGSGCDNCEPPTLGLNKQGDRRMVDGGFTCNGQTVDVENYYTDFPTITNAVGTPLRCSFVIYEDTHSDNIRHFEFAVGKRVDDYMSDVQGKIVWDRDFKLQETVTYDTQMFRDVSVSALGNTKCTDESTSKQCMLLYLTATPRQPLVNDIIVKTNVWDENRNAKQNFYNDGIDFVGFTENPMPFYKVVDGRNGITTIYTTDPTLEDLNTAIDQYGNTWTKTNGFWKKDYVKPDMSCNVSSYLGPDRTCPEFSLLKEGQLLLAQQYFDSSKIQSEPSESFAYEYPESRDRLEGTQLG